jgi:hypothetical protein
MPISGEGTLSSPAVPKYRAKVEVQHNYVFDSNGEPMYVEYTTTDEIGAELLKNSDVEKVNDESVIDALKRAGASEADIERVLEEWGLKKPAV